MHGERRECEKQEAGYVGVNPKRNGMLQTLMMIVTYWREADAEVGTNWGLTGSLLRA